MSSFIEVTCSDAVLEISINRPEKKNALTGDMYRALVQALEGAQQNDAVKAVLLSGAGGAFSAGNDIADFIADPPVTPDAAAWQFFAALMKLDKPLVAAVDGLAIGVGTTALLHCDLVYASPRSTFALPFVNLGLTPEGVSTLLLPLLIGRQRSAELLLLGEKISAEKACALGLINEVVEADALLERALARARQLAALPCDVVRKTKRLLQGGLAPLVARQFEAECLALGEAIQGPAAQAAFAKFMSARKPAASA
jgi:enoyl-CoA hydratase/carnithine racemase